MPGGRGQMSWTPEADQKLLLAILAEHDVKLEWEKVGKNLGCTARAVQERIKKLKLKAKGPKTKETAATAEAPEAVPVEVKQHVKANSVPKKATTTPPSKKRKTKASGTTGLMFPNLGHPEAVEGSGAVEDSSVVEGSSNGNDEEIAVVEGMAKGIKRRHEDEEGSGAYAEVRNKVEESLGGETQTRED